MSEGLQQSAGDRMRRALNLMTGNRIAGLFTGFGVTAIIQSSTACIMLVISFVNAGLLTLTQSIGVIFGANIGTTLTAWIISVVGFRISLSEFAVPIVGIGFILSIIKWNYKSAGGFLMGFGFLFLGLSFLTDGMREIQTHIPFDAIGAFRDMGYLAILIAIGVGLVMSVLVNSSTASIAIIMTMAYSNVITYDMAAGMVLGANIGTTANAPLAAIGGTTATKRAALAHVLFNVVGAMWAFPLLFPMLRAVDFSTPAHLAMLHTIYNVINVILFLPFVNQYSKLITFLIRDKKQEEDSGHYRFTYLSSVKASTPEFNILRVEKEIRDMAGIVSSMYSKFSNCLQSLLDAEDKQAAVVKLSEELKQKEDYVDEMRETLTGVLIECTREKLSARTERRVSQLLRNIGDIEEMSDECYSISRLLEKSVRKDRIFKKEEMDELVPYVDQVGGFLNFLQEQLGQNLTLMSTVRTKKLEANIGKSRKRLQKLSRKRIEAGKNVKTELLFIDLVKRIEKLGDYCENISGGLGKFM